jgi:hypothetical protein
MNFRYDLEKRAKKSICPECKRRSFVRYVDLSNNEPLPVIYGRCDRETNCTYHVNPYTTGYESGTAPEWNPAPKVERPPVYIPSKVLEGTQGRERLNKNTFLLNLVKNSPFPLPVEDILKAVELYKLGTVTKGLYSGAITFPFIDVNENIRAIQVKNFDRANHTTRTTFLTWIIEKHYEKNGKPLPEWLAAWNDNELKVSCLFGEHLLSKYPNNPVALVEAPKTAVIGSLYFGLPESENNFIWLAVFNKSSFNLKRLRALTGRNVLVFPDLSPGGKTFAEWKDKAIKYAPELPDTNLVFFEHLEKTAKDENRQKGEDLADYLQNYNWRIFRNRPELLTKTIKL